MTAREFTFRLLLRQKKEGAYSNLLLDNHLKASDLSGQDKAFATALFYGVIETQIYLDYQLEGALKQPLKKLRDEVFIALRMGVYQLFLMDKVPAAAAINESVKLVKKHGCAYAAGLVNAVLRALSRSGERLPEQSDKRYLSVKYAIPQALIDLWIKDYGKSDTIGILESFSTKSAQTVVRVNTLLCDRDSLLQRLKSEGVEARVNEAVENSLVLKKSGALTLIPSFREGLFHVEDTAAQKAALLLGALEGERVLDTCAAPGGKSFTVAEQMKSGEVLACDIYESRVALIREGAQRLHIPFIKACVQDASEYHESLGLFDRVLCDVPCSGLGTIAKKPEIRYKTKEQIMACVPVQKRILATSFRYLKPGGTLVYATCTLNKAENEEVIEAFLRESKAQLVFQKTFFPHTDTTDGFFAAVIKKDDS